MKILVNDALAKEAVDMMREHHEVDAIEYDPEELVANIGKYDAIVVRGRTKVRENIIEAGSNLKVIGRAGIGVDNVDVKVATGKGIPVVNAPSGSTFSVAELTIGHMISMARKISLANRSMKDGKWEKKKFKGTEIHGKTLGFIGIGRIGWEVAVRCKAFGMNIVAYDPYLPKEHAAKLGGKMVDTVEEVYAEADIITLHTPLTPETKHMISTKQFGLMKNTAFIINCARGGIIDEDALYIALKEGQIAAAALDSYEKEPLENSKLTELDNCFFTPHVGASTKEAQIKAGTIVAEQVLKVLAGDKPDFIVNRQVLD